ncbi:MAG: hypothetical protein AAGJ56_08360, partial [Myxococcota bacterium]
MKPVTIGIWMLALTWPARSMAEDEAKSAATLDQAYAREVRLLQRERVSLQEAIDDGTKISARAEVELESEIEELGAELVRLRADNEAREARLPAWVGSTDAESQTEEIEAVHERVARWLREREESATESDPVLKALERLKSSRGVRRESVAIFHADGKADRADVLRIGEVVALSDSAALVPVEGGFVAAPIPNRRVDTAEGVIRTAMLYRPDEQVDPEAYRAATLLERLQAGGVLVWPIVLLAMLAALVVM